MVGFPENGCYGPTKLVVPKDANFYAPEGFQCSYREQPDVKIHSYAWWVYGDPAAGREGTYGGTVGAIPMFPATAETERGPSSDHPGIINHLFADGHVSGLSKQMDSSTYFFAITRAGGDPGPDYWTRRP